MEDLALMEPPHTEPWQAYSGGSDPVVTISATYGAGGSVIAPAVAARLGMPMVDRLVSADLAHGAAASGEAISEEEQRATPHGRFFTYLAQSAPFGASVAPPIVDLDDDEVLRNKAEQPIFDLRSSGGGVVLGRAAAAVLREQPAVYHIRLDGPEERRVSQAAHLEHVSEEEARRRMAETDRVRSLYVRRLYRSDPADPRLYHLILDTTVLSLEATIEVIAAACRGALAI